MPFEYRTAQPFEFGINGRHLVFLFTGLVFKWSVLYIQYSLRQTIWNPNFKVWYSNVSGIQIPTVFGFPLDVYVNTWLNLNEKIQNLDSSEAVSCKAWWLSSSFSLKTSTWWTKFKESKTGYDQFQVLCMYAIVPWLVNNK